MPEKLKHIFFTKETINQFADRIADVYPGFAKDKFIELIYSIDWESLELKEKMRHVAVCLHEFLHGDFEQAIDVLIKIAPDVKGFEGMVLPDYVELYGLEHWDISLKALKEFTKYSSSEFAIRPFIQKNPEKAIEFMAELSTSKNENIRRFASEGCRPRLPWAMALPDFKKDPSPIIPILETLKDDESEFVRRSVANNLNDISKDNPEISLKLCKSWIGKSEKTDWIVKHACRTLLKAGDKRALILFGYEDPGHIKIENFNIVPIEVKIGDYLKFSFLLNITGKKKAKLRLEYAIDYLKSNNTHNRKVFKITENTYSPGEHKFKKRHSFAEMSTRRHYAGIHKVSIIVNGEIKGTKEFQVNH